MPYPLLIWEQIQHSIHRSRGRRVHWSVRTPGRQASNGYRAPACSVDRTVPGAHRGTAALACAYGWPEAAAGRAQTPALAPPKLCRLQRARAPSPSRRQDPSEHLDHSRQCGRPPAACPAAAPRAERVAPALGPGPAPALQRGPQPRSAPPVRRPCRSASPPSRRRSAPGRPRAQPTAARSGRGAERPLRRLSDPSPQLCPASAVPCPAAPAGPPSQAELPRPLPGSASTGRRTTDKAAAVRGDSGAAPGRSYLLPAGAAASAGGAGARATPLPAVGPAPLTSGNGPDHARRPPRPAPGAPGHGGAGGAVGSAARGGGSRTALRGRPRIFQRARPTATPPRRGGQARTPSRGGWCPAPTSPSSAATRGRLPGCHPTRLPAPHHR